MYHGGPGANYGTHALCALTDRLRADKGKYGLVYAPGGMNTKHIVGIYSTSCPPAPWRREPPSENKARMAALPRRSVAKTPRGRGRIETYTVQHSRNIPTRTIIIGTLFSDSGDERFVAASADKDICAAATREDLIGRLVDLSTDNIGQVTFVLAGAAKL